MVTNTVNDLFPNSGAWNLVLNAQGRIQGDLTVWRGGEELSPQRRNPAGATPGNGDRLLGTPFAGESGLELEIAADQYEKLMAHLNRFIIMDDVELVPLSLDAQSELSGESALGVSGPLAADLLARLGFAAPTEAMTSAPAEWQGQPMRVVRGYGALIPHYELWVKADQIHALWTALKEAGATPVGAAALNAFRIAEGIPVYGIDIAERDLPQETSQMHALSFNKGCYLGQEIVERIRSRGNVHRHLRLLEVAGPLPEAGMELKLEGGASAGQITSAAELPFAVGKRIFALAMIQAAAEMRNQPLAYCVGGEAGTARLLAAPVNLEAAQ
jgi:folate-binding protein YgfZ